jgi:phage baseplate assembly protein W
LNALRFCEKQKLLTGKIKLDINFPFKFDNRGRTAEAGDEKHIKDMIEQVLFTSPGERVNRPSFGCGLLQLVFQPNSDELATTTQFLVQGSLQQWLGDLIQVDEVQVENEESSLHVKIVYTVRRTQERQVAQFRRGVL